MLRSIEENGGGSGPLDFESLVTLYYETLYRFALSLTHSEADACDLTQQTFYAWGTKGAQLRDPSKVKTWLFTTLHRAFLQIRRRQIRFPHFELSEVAPELPCAAPARSHQSDLDLVVAALAEMDQNYRAPVALFYLEDYAYKEIAQVLHLPMGTVKSRIARGIAQLKNLLEKTHRSSRPVPAKEPRFAGVVRRPVAATPAPAFCC